MNNENVPISASIVVLAYGEEPTLVRCISAIRETSSSPTEIIVVDNGCNPAVIKEIQSRGDVTVLGPPVNRGFAGGCNFGVDAATGDVVVLLNSDAFVTRGALSQLIAAASADDIGIAMGLVALDDEPHLVNSAGNPVHFSGVCWAGRYREPVTAITGGLQDVPTASGAAMALRRTLWQELGGFDPAYFAYMEDAELSIRCWQRGARVVLVPTAVVRHRYEFSRNRLKFYLIERNRLLFLLTTYELRTLVLLAPALIAVEVAMMVQAALGSWMGAKLQGYYWLIRKASFVRRRRAEVQQNRRRSDKELQWLFCDRIEPANVEMPPGMGLFNNVLAGYWRLVRRFI